MSSDKPTALITGASTGIGRSAAVALAKNGYDIVINYSRSEDAAKTTARKAEAVGSNTMASLVASASRLTIAAGVPLGRNIAFQVVTSMSVMSAREPLGNGGFGFFVARHGMAERDAHPLVGQRTNKPLRHAFRR